MRAASNTATPDDLQRLRRRPPRRLEDTFTSQVKRYAQRGGFLAYHTLRSKGSDPGLPDLILIRGNRLVVAELKVPPNIHPSAWQDCWLTGFRTLAMLAGPHLSLEVYVWQPSDWPEISRVLE